MAAQLQDRRLLVQIATYNTNLQGRQGVPQDLVDWLSPTLHVSSFLAHDPRAPDLIAVGFQELLPLHLGLSGLSRSVLNDRQTHVLSQIEANAPGKESYSLVSSVANAGVALLVFAKDSGVGQRIRDVQTQWTGCGPFYMGNKGAVGVRLRVAGEDGGIGETFTFVCAHLTADSHKLSRRIGDYHHIVGSLTFPPLPSSESQLPSTIYETSHLFLLGDLNFRIALPTDHHLSGPENVTRLVESLSSNDKREEIKEFDQLLVERRKGSAFIGLREGKFWQFPCSYKFEIGKVNQYNLKRVPSWTDRILYTTYTDNPANPDISNIANVLYTSVPSYTTSDHKPVVSLLLIPAADLSPASCKTLPVLQLPSHYTPSFDPRANTKKYIGRGIDRIIGYTWWLLTMLGAGSTVVGIFNFILGLGAWGWWKIGPLSYSTNAGTAV